MKIKLPWLVAKTATVPAEPPRVEPEPVTETLPLSEAAPEPTPPLASAAAVPATATPTRVMLALATILTLASAAWTVWSVYDLIGHVAASVPMGAALAPAIGAEVVWLAMAAVEWQRIHRTGTVPPGLVIAGWVMAGVTALILAVHAFVLALALLVLAPLPIGSKLMLHWALADVADAVRAQAEAQRRAEVEEAEREQAEAEADNDSLTVEERRLLAERRRALKLRQELAKLDQAEAEQKHAERVAQIERDGTEELALARTHYTVAREIQRHDREVGYRQASVPLALGSGSYIPDDASALNTPTAGGAGFGAGMAQTRMQAPTVRTGSDQKMPGVPGKVPTPSVEATEHPSVVEARRNRAACELAFQELLEERCEVPSIAAVAGAAGVSERAAGRHLRALGLIPPASKSTN